MFSYEYCEIFKKTIFTEHRRTTTSAQVQFTFTIISLLFHCTKYEVFH